MEDYLQYMKSLRTQINDAEDQVAKVSVEEQTQITIIHNLEKDLSSAKSTAQQVTDDVDQMLKTTADIRAKILEKQMRISSLETDCSSLAQTLELVQQEKIGLTAKLMGKRMYYTELRREMNSTLLQIQKDSTAAGLTICLPNKESDMIDATDMGDKETKAVSVYGGHASCLDENGEEELIKELEIAKAELEHIINAKNDLVSENNKISKSIEQMKCQINDMGLQLESKGMDITSLEDEQKALSSDKTREEEYKESLQPQIERLKGISHVTRCTCGQEYKVEENCSAIVKQVGNVGVN